MTLKIKIFLFFYLKSTLPLLVGSPVKANLISALEIPNYEFFVNSYFQVSQNGVLHRFSINKKKQNTCVITSHQEIFQLQGGSKNEFQYYIFKSQQLHDSSCNNTTSDLTVENSSRGTSPNIMHTSIRYPKRRYTL